jgi:RNA recognition motif. (a.k.a. RRM, RBD, or RNP domain)
VASVSPSTDLGATPAFRASSALGDHPKTVNPLSGTQPCHTSIVVHNLPAFLFAQDSDLEPLFCPFGDVKEIRKHYTSSIPQSPNSVSAVVTYSSVAGARDAKAALHGQSYGDNPLVVESFLPFDNESSWKLDRYRFSGSPLNPRASPFVFESASVISAPPTCVASGDFHDYFLKPISSGLTTPLNDSSLSESGAQGHSSLPTSSLPSRSNSAASWSFSLARSGYYA